MPAKHYEFTPWLWLTLLELFWGPKETREKKLFAQKNYKLNYYINPMETARELTKLTSKKFFFLLKIVSTMGRLIFWMCFYSYMVYIIGQNYIFLIVLQWGLLLVQSFSRDWKRYFTVENAKIVEEIQALGGQ